MRQASDLGEAVLAVIKSGFKRVAGFWLVACHDVRFGACCVRGRVHRLRLKVGPPEQAQT